MSEKVKVSREVAKAIEQAIENAKNVFPIHRRNRKNVISELIIRNAIGSRYLHELEVLNKLSVYEFAEILIVGYEIEETPEEKILRQYRDIEDDYNTDFQDEERYVAGYRDGVEDVLNAYNTKIKGINE